MYCRDIGVQISLIISLFSMPGLAASSYAYSADEKCGAFLPKGVQDAIYSIIDDPEFMKQHFPEIHGTSDYVFLSGGTFLPTGFDRPHLSGPS